MRMSLQSTFPFQSLGWKAFQDLCGTVLSEILGQTFIILEPGNDIGRDGGFSGIWERQKGESLHGPFVVQCKHTINGKSGLRISHLKTEIEKLKLLKARGLCETYLIMTNYAVTVERAESIRRWITRETDIQQVEVFGSAWLDQRIRENHRLRMLVPRIYGLGDLTQILDERAYEQAEHLLASIHDDLRKFVPTDSYRSAVHALESHNFVLLLGEPAAGKTTIAATLAVSAMERWNCRVVRVESPSDFRSHWNPNEPDQFFWIEDAFGATQFQKALVNEWNQALPALKASIAKGSRIVVTSRDYIYNQARLELKAGELPLLNEAQVVVDVENLSPLERRDILYNHIKLGTQPKEFKTKIKRHLPKIIELHGFSPEAARRLGSPTFTRNFQLSLPALTNFVERKQAFLVDVIRGLSDDQRAALMLIFLKGGRLNIPVTSDHTLEDFAQRLGSSAFACTRAMSAMQGSLTRIEWQEDQSYWTFRHPTMRDAISAIVQEDANLLDIYIAAATDRELLSEVVCGEADVRGANVRIPLTLFPDIMRRLDKCLARPGAWDKEDGRNRDGVYLFLAHRCSKIFLEQFTYERPALVQTLSKVNSFLGAMVKVDLMATLYEMGLLPEDVRQRYVDVVRELAVDTPDADWIGTGPAARLLTDAERRELLLHVYEELIPSIDDIIDVWIDNEPYELHGKAAEYFDPLIVALESYQIAFTEEGGYDDALPKLELAKEGVNAHLLEYEFREEERSMRGVSWHFDQASTQGGEDARDSFDDVDV